MKTKHESHSFQVKDVKDMTEQEGMQQLNKLFACARKGIDSDFNLSEDEKKQLHHSLEQFKEAMNEKPSAPHTEPDLSKEEEVLTPDEPKIDAATSDYVAKSDEGQSESTATV